MPKDRFQRTEMLLGREAMERLSRARVAVFGVGGVGGYVCEALVRSGIGHFLLTDNDVVSLSNLNRQIIATEKTVGRQKTEVMRERMLSIDPAVDVSVRNCFFLPENAASFPFSEFDYVVDAVDTVTAKIEIILRAQKAGVPVISAMGAGNKLAPGRFRVSDIYETDVCPLAKVMRRELRKRGVKALKVVWSDEPPVKPARQAEVAPAETACSGEMGSPGDGASRQPVPGCSGTRRAIPGSIAYAPAIAGLMIAGEVIRDLTKGEKG